MIAKITSPDNCRRATDYIMAINKEDKKTRLLAHSDGVLATDNKTIAACLEAAALYKDHNLKKPFKHISLDFHKQDEERLTDDFMKKIAGDYMERMGYTNTEFVIYRHFDKEHPHCHILASRVNRDGEVISDSRERERNVAVCKLINQAYMLHMSEGKIAVKRDRLRGKTKTRYDLMDKVIKARDKSEDWKEFEGQLKEMGIKMRFHYNNVTRKLLGVSFSDGSISFSGKKLDTSLTYKELAGKFGDIHQLAHDNVKEFYNDKRDELLRLNPERYKPAIYKAFPDFDSRWSLDRTVRSLPSALTLMSRPFGNMREYVDYNPDEYIHSDDHESCYIPLGLMVAVALAPFNTPIVQCSGGGGGGSSSDLGYKDDDNKDKWKFRFKYNRARSAQHKYSKRR